MRAWTALGPLLSLFVVTNGISLRRKTGDQQTFSSSSWLEYNSGRRGLPDCCGDNKDCKMVRINEALIADVKSSFSAKEYTSTSGVPTDITAEYDAKLGSLKGLVRTNGQTFSLEPLSGEQRSNPKCGVLSQKSRINLFHTITLYTAKSAPAPSLPYLFQPLGPGSRQCCAGASQCTRVNVNKQALLHNSIRLPGNGDSGVVYVLAVTNPRNCAGLCNLYYFRGQKTNGRLKITPKDNRYELTEGSSLFHLSQCGNHLYWSNGPKTAANSIKNSGALNYDRDMDKPVSFGVGRSSTVGSSDCWFNQTKYCNPDYNQVAAPIVAKGINCEHMSQYCHDQCLQTPGCEYFTFFQGRLTAKCHFLSDCVEVRSASCLTQENCLSGAKECSDPHGTGCTGPVEQDSKYSVWTCTDRYGNMLEDQYAADMPLNTICVQRCNNWVDNQGHPGYLQSICQDTGVWSETTSQNGGTLAFPTGPYAEPDDHADTASEPLAVCSCDPLTIRWPPNDPSGFSYDPNNEEGAKFICDIPVSNSSGPIVINPGNECRLFCDNHHFVTVTCADGEWTGHADTRGLWCYTRPDGNGTCGANCIGTWMDWGPWSSCDMSDAINVGYGTKTRTRPCSGGICEGAPQNGIETDKCNEWSEWSSCDVFSGTRTRTRNTDTQTEDCDVDGQWGAYGPYGACDPTTGYKIRTRVCNNPQQWNNGLPCQGSATDSATCPVDGGYTEWSTWTALDEATWTSERTRTCTNPVPLNNGADCTGLGAATETQSSSITIQVTAIRMFYETPVAQAYAEDQASNARTVGDGNGVISITISQRGSYSYQIGENSNNYHLATRTINMDCDYSSCETAFTQYLFKKHPFLQAGEIAVNLYWLTNAEDLDINVMSVPRDTNEPTCRQYWGRNNLMSPPRCPGVQSGTNPDGTNKLGADCKLPDYATSPCNEYVVLDGNLEIDYAIGPEDAMIFKGANVTIETTDHIQWSQLEPQISQAPSSKSAWFVGCVWGTGMDTSYATANNNAVLPGYAAFPNYGQSPTYISHELLPDWITAMKTWCTGSTGAAGRRKEFFGKSLVDMYDFDCDKDSNMPCY